MGWNWGASAYQELRKGALMGLSLHTAFYSLIQWEYWNLLAGIFLLLLFIFHHLLSIFSPSFQRLPTICFRSFVQSTFSWPTHNLQTALEVTSCPRWASGHAYGGYRPLIQVFHVQVWQADESWWPEYPLPYKMRMSEFLLCLLLLHRSKPSENPLIGA